MCSKFGLSEIDAPIFSHFQLLSKKNVPAAHFFSFSLMKVVFGPWMRKFIELTVCRVCKFMNLQVS